nr:NAD(+) synthase [Pirellula staleyi]
MPIQLAAVTAGQDARKTSPVKLIRVGAAVLNQTPLDWDGNRDRILEAIELARSQSVSILCLPELCITGYGCEDAFHAPGTQSMAVRVLEEILPHTQGMIVSLGLPVMYHGSLYNAACLVVDGEVVGLACKQNLAGEGIHYEPRWFKPWPSMRQSTIDFAGRTLPIGDIVFECGDVRLGFEICEDAWVAERPGSLLATHGVDLILNPSASHFAFGKHEIRKRFVIEGSRAFQVGYVYANLLGNESGRAIYDGDAMIAASGNLLALGERFSYREVQVIAADVDINNIRMNRARSGSFRPVIATEAWKPVKSKFAFPDRDPVRTEVKASPWESSPTIKEEEFTRAVSLALLDYCRKSRSRGFVVSLSGGADSSGVSVLIASMVRFALAEIGAEKLASKMPYLPKLANAKTSHDFVRQLLSCVYQSTRNSGDVTRNAARTLAVAIGADYLEFDVDPLVQHYIQMVAGAIGRELDWKQDDLALQNIQARTRSPGVWMLANLRGALLLATSNRSEAAVGYATMDGDTSGGLSPIAGIDKAFLRKWLRWMQKEGPQGLAPITELSVVTDQPPTAELRPPSAKQTDEDDLMPYEVLDAIERAAIRDKLSPTDIQRAIGPDFPHYSVDQMAFWIERFFVLFARNQWKRERYAPSFHLDDENLDPKTWCRFPILSGGFARELAEFKRSRGDNQ